MTTERNIIIHQGQAFELSLDYAGTPGRAQRMHIRMADGTATIVQALSHNGAANARVIYNDSTQQLDIIIGATVSAAWVVLADRVEWTYDIEDYDPADEDDTIIPYRGKTIVRGNRTRPEDATLSPQMPNGDSRYTRFDGEQNLTPEQMAQAQINILGEEYAPGGGSGDVVGPASATDDRIAAFDSTTGKLIKQGSVTATAVASHLGSTSNPHSVTAAQVGADPTGTAAAAVAAHSGATDPHGDRAYADGLAGNYATAGHNHTGVYQPLATVLTNTTASFTSAQETKLAGIETAADVTDAGNVGAAIDGATAKTTPVDADTVPLIDSAAANVLKKLSWANIKATAKAYFDTLYQAILVSGTNIKTVNSTSLLGSGDIAISASPGGSTTQLQYNNASAFGGMSGTAWDDTNRSLTITGATVTTSKPILDLSQTWNNAAVAFTGVKVNVTNTASAASSLLQDWQVGGASVAKIYKTGAFQIFPSTGGTYNANFAYTYDDRYANFALRTGTTALFLLLAESGGTTVYMQTKSTGGTFFFAKDSSTGTFTIDTAAYTTKTRYTHFAGTLALDGGTTTYDLYLQRDAAGVLAQRNGTNAQTFRVYGTYTDASNYVRASLAATSTTVTLAAETAGTGADNVPVVITPAGTSQIEVGNGVQFTEMTAPSAPAANKVILYAQDNGAGKTQLMALFASGASQQVAIEP